MSIAASQSGAPIEYDPILAEHCLDLMYLIKKLFHERIPTDPYYVPIYSRWFFLATVAAIASNDALLRKETPDFFKRIDELVNGGGEPVLNTVLKCSSSAFSMASALGEAFDRVLTENQYEDHSLAVQFIEDVLRSGMETQQ